MLYILTACEPGDNAECPQLDSKPNAFGIAPTKAVKARTLCSVLTLPHKPKAYTALSSKGKNFAHACPAQPAATTCYAVDAQHYILHSSLTAQPGEPQIEEAESMANWQYALNESLTSTTKSS